MLHRPRTLPPAQLAMAAPPVIVFDGAGNFVKAWGGDGKGYEWPEREHGIYIDYKGFVWIGGNNCPARKLPGLKPVADDQLLKFTQDGKFVMQIGHSNRSGGNADTKNLQQPADEFVYGKTNELFVADGYGNHRVAIYDAETGSSSACGARSGTNRKIYFIAHQKASIRCRTVPDLSNLASCMPFAFRPMDLSMWPIVKTGGCRCSRSKASSSSKW